MDTREFRNALGNFATGIAVITTKANGRPATGVTSNSFNSVSLEPPLVLWSLARSASSFETFEKASHFNVHILSAGQHDLSFRFAKSGGDKFEGLAHNVNRYGIPVLPGCAAQFECRKRFAYNGGDHVIYVGEVLDFRAPGGDPLIYHGGRYGELKEKVTA